MLNAEQSVDPNHDSHPRLKIEPINEQAILQELSDTASAQPVAPVQPAIAPLEPVIAQPFTAPSHYTEQHADNFHAGPTQPVVPDVPRYTSAVPGNGAVVSPVPVPGFIGANPPAASDIHPVEMTVPWRRVVISGAAILVLGRLILEIIMYVFGHFLYKVLFSGASTEFILGLYTWAYRIEFAVASVITLFVGFRIAKSMQLFKPRLTVIATLITAAALANVFISLYTDYGSSLVPQNIVLTYIIDFSCYAIAGMISIILVSLAIKFLLSRIVKPKLFTLAILIIFSLPVLSLYTYQYVRAYQQRVQYDQKLNALDQSLKQADAIREANAYDFTPEGIAADLAKSKVKGTATKTYEGFSYSYQTLGWIHKYGTVGGSLNTVDYKRETTTEAVTAGAAISFDQRSYQGTYDEFKASKTTKDYFNTISNVKELSRTDGLKSFSFTNTFQNSPHIDNRGNTVQDTAKVTYITYVVNTKDKSYAAIYFVGTASPESKPDYQEQMKTILDSMKVAEPLYMTTNV